MSAAGGRARILLMAVMAAAAALSTGGTMSARAVQRPGAASLVTYVMSRAAQEEARAFWTPARMAATMKTPTMKTGGSRTAGQPAPAARPPRGTPTAVRFSGVPTSGALFYTTGSRAHFCTASAVDSRSGDLVITAAHCVYSTSYSSDMAYVPDYHDGQSPYGTWTVRAITTAAGWRTAHEPDLDIAFLAVTGPGGRPIQEVTGGLTLSTGGPYAQTAEVIGYNDGSTLPVRCLTRSRKFSAGQLEFYCHGFRAGTSGGPWIAAYHAPAGTGIVFGVIGGFEGGGDYEWASYSPYFGAQVASLFQQAQRQPTGIPVHAGLMRPLLPRVIP